MEQLLQERLLIAVTAAADALHVRTLIDHCITENVEERLDAATASFVQFWCTDMQNKVVDRCLQVFGGYGCRV